eukprot:g20589.t1
MPPLPVLGKLPSDGGVSDETKTARFEANKTPFNFSQLDLGSIGVAKTNANINTKRPPGRKRAVTSVTLEDDDDPLEEAQAPRVVGRVGGF